MLHVRCLPALCASRSALPSSGLTQHLHSTLIARLRLSYQHQLHKPSETMSERHLAAGDPLPPTTPGLMRIYSMRFCPYAERTRLVLAAKKIPHETVNVNLAHKPDWLFEINPEGKVPVLELDGKVLNESLVTSDFLDEEYPENPLHPSDPYTKARQRLLVEAFGQQVISSFFALVRGSKGGDVAQLAEQHFSKYEKFEKELDQSGKPYFAGDRPGMVDLMIFPWVERLPAVAELLGPAASFPAASLQRVAAWIERMRAEPAVRACVTDLPDTLRFLRSYLAGAPQYD